MRRIQHHARLNEEPTDVPMTQWVEERDALLMLWRRVMGG